MAVEPPLVGPKAAFLLGLIVGAPRTAPELVEMAARAEELLDEWQIEFPVPVHGSPLLAARMLSAEGETLVVTLLERLERTGFATCVNLDGERLWRAV